MEEENRQLEIVNDPRFRRAVALFNEGEFLEASDLFEELFFEGVNDEPEFIRIFLQFSVGIFHAQMSQRRPAVERIEEGLRVVETNVDDRGFDLTALAAGMRAVARCIREQTAPTWPRISRRAQLTDKW